MFKYYFNLLLFLSFIPGLNAQNDIFKEKLDSIQKLKKLIDNNNLILEDRIGYAKQAIVLAKKTKEDSVILKANINLAWTYSLDAKYFKISEKLFHKSLKQSSQKKDSSGIAFISIHLGYINGLFKTKRDSAYYYYYNTLKFSKEGVFQVLALENIAVLQSNERDYVGSQTTLIQAINVLHTLSENKENQALLSDAYISLGLNLKSLKRYDKALEYYQKALEINQKTPGDFIGKIYAKINITEVYKETGNYKKVFKIYNELLEEDKLFEKDPGSYGATLNNIAYTLFLSGDKNHSKIDSLFTKAYHIFEDLELYYELSAGGNDMSEFYASIKQKEKALFYAEEAYEISNSISEYDEKLRALKQLSKLKEGEAGKAYLYKYIALNDSLIDNERVNRNKFARIQFETDQYIKEAKRLSTQNILISIIASVLMATLGLLYFIRKQRDKNKRLLFEKQQQESNQDIYSLMLKQQDKLEEARLEERHRIAEDLHDGILSQLFGTRMGLGFLDIKGANQTLKNYNLFIDELQKIEKEIRDVSHELKQDESLTKNNFETIIDQYLKQQSIIGNFKYTITNNYALFNTINDSVKVNIYRIIQEATQNIIKHANAKNMTICFSLEANILNLLIEDNGVGFNVKAHKKGIGLKNIASRVLNLKGTIKIDSILDNKTSIQIMIPV